MEASMMRLMLGFALAFATMVSLTEAPAWAARGGVRKCDLAGVNPADHKGIFKSEKTAAKYGFVKGSDGKWTVIPNCHISS